jgi:hypothetical protein
MLITLECDAVARHRCVAEIAAHPAIAEAMVLVRVMAASINPSDVKNVAGVMKQTTLPHGREGQTVDGRAKHDEAPFCALGSRLQQARCEQRQGFVRPHDRATLTAKRKGRSSSRSIGVRSS